MSATAQVSTNEPVPPLEDTSLATQLEAVSTALVKIDKVAAGIADLRAKYGSVVFDVATTKGMKEACDARAEIREPRYEIERLRKAAKRPILDLGKKLDTEAERITNELLAIEGPLDLQIKAEEQRKADEKKAREEAEAKRVAAIRGRIEDDIRAVPLACIGRSAHDIAIFIKDIEAMVIDHTFAEFQKEAEGAKATTLIRLRAALANAVSMEAEQARLAAERAENERIRQENEAAAKVERERAAEAQRLAKEELERERLRQQAAADVERARIAEEERIAKAARDAETARQAAENERIRAQHERDAALERARLQREEEALEARREAQRLEEWRLSKEREAQAWERHEADLARQAETQRIADERAQLEREQADFQRMREVGDGAPVGATTSESGDSNIVNEAESKGSVSSETESGGSVSSNTSGPEGTLPQGDADPLLMTIRLTEYLPMESVCKFAKEWAVFQHNKPEQKKDRKLAAQAKEAEIALLSAAELLP